MGNMLWKWIESDLHGGHLGSWGKSLIFHVEVIFFLKHMYLYFTLFD